MAKIPDFAQKLIDETGEAIVNGKLVKKAKEEPKKPETKKDGE